jgi:predicted translin family RNA/ssDNA-binding protein
MILVITIRKPVKDQQQAEALFTELKRRLEDHPELSITGTCTQPLAEQGEP